MARFTLDTDPTFDKTLADLIQSTGGTKADVIRKAVATFKFLKSETLDNTGGLKVSITNKENQVVKDIILP